jgi:hypothetical protein
LFESLDVLPPPKKREPKPKILDNLKGFHEPTQKDFEGIVGEGLGDWLNAFKHESLLKGFNYKN